jgi:hypothetical protein
LRLRAKSGRTRSTCVPCVITGREVIKCLLQIFLP